jgi:hypothetical protein
MLENIILLYLAGGVISSIVHLLSWTYIDRDIDREIDLDRKLYNVVMVFLLWVKYLPWEMYYIADVCYIKIKYAIPLKLMLLIKNPKRFFKTYVLPQKGTPKLDKDIEDKLNQIFKDL